METCKMWEQSCKLENDLCRCCHDEGTFVNLAVPQTVDDEKEVYSDMLRDFLDIHIAPIDGELHNMTYTICSPCIMRLRDAAQFKTQVLCCENRFRELYVKKWIVKDKSPDIKVEVDDVEDVIDEEYLEWDEEKTDVIDEEYLESEEERIEPTVPSDDVVCEPKVEKDDIMEEEYIETDKKTNDSDENHTSGKEEDVAEKPKGRFRKSKNDEDDEEYLPPEMTRRRSGKLVEKKKPAKQNTEQNERKKPDARPDLGVVIKMAKLGYSQRTIADELGTSRKMVRGMLERYIKTNGKLVIDPVEVRNHAIAKANALRLRFHSGGSGAVRSGTEL